MKIEYVTGNAGKFREASLILADWELEQVSLDLDEIQGDRQQVLLRKAQDAMKQLHRPLVVEDVSLCCNALQGLPGPYIKEFLERLSERGLAELIHRYEDHRAQVICAVAYMEPNSEPVIFEGILHGAIVLPRGMTRIGKQSFNPIFQPDGSAQTQGELTIEEHSQTSHRYLALIQLRDYLKRHHDR